MASIMLSVRVPKPLWEALDEVARARDVTRAELVRDALTAALNGHDPKEEASDDPPPG